MLARIGVVLGFAAFANACSSSSCDQSGCDAVRSPTSGISVGIGGAVVMQSDFVSNGCQECPFSQAQVQMWKVDAPSTPGFDVVAIGGKPPIVTISAAPFFRKTLDPGTYVVCADGQCIEASVQAGQVTTVNIMKRDGPVAFWTADGSGQFTESPGITR